MNAVIPFLTAACRRLQLSRIFTVSLRHVHCQYQIQLRSYCVRFLPWRKIENWDRRFALNTVSQMCIFTTAYSLNNIVTLTFVSSPIHRPLSKSSSWLQSSEWSTVSSELPVGLSSIRCFLFMLIRDRRFAKFNAAHPHFRPEQFLKGQMCAFFRIAVPQCLRHRGQVLTFAVSSIGWEII